jgi:transcriptional regulator of heat shock response
MIRLELDALEAAGFLEQPYHSAGRVPSDRGYEFFAAGALAAADRAMQAVEANARARARREAETNDAFARFFEQRAWPELLNELSSELGLLGVAADMMNHEVYKVGLESLVDHLNWENRDEIRSVIRDFEEVEERMPEAAEKVGGPKGAVTGPQVFIGKKSPVTRSENLSVVCGNYKIGGGSGDTGDTIISIFAIGPKRMDYRRTIRIFTNL